MNRKEVIKVVYVAEGPKYGDGKMNERWRRKDERKMKETER